MQSEDNERSALTSTPKQQRQAYRRNATNPSGKREPRTNNLNYRLALHYMSRAINSNILGKPNHIFLFMLNCTFEDLLLSKYAYLELSSVFHFIYREHCGTHNHNTIKA